MPWPSWPEAGRRPPPGAVMGVWAARRGDAHVFATRTAGGWRLQGTKPWASGARMLTHALVTATAARTATASSRSPSTGDGVTVGARHLARGRHGHVGQRRRRVRRHGRAPRPRSAPRGGTSSGPGSGSVRSVWPPAGWAAPWAWCGPCAPTWHGRQPDAPPAGPPRRGGGPSCCSMARDIAWAARSHRRPTRRTRPRPPPGGPGGPPPGRGGCLDVLAHVGRAGGAGPALPRPRPRPAAWPTWPVYIRQHHAERDDEALGRSLLDTGRPAGEHSAGKGAGSRRRRDPGGGLVGVAPGRLPELTLERLPSGGGRRPPSRRRGAGRRRADAAPGSRGTAVTVVGVTDGEASHPRSPSVLDAMALADRRARERRRALRAPRPGPTCRSSGLGLPDGAVAGQTAELVAVPVGPAGPDVLCVAPWERDGHPDHDAAGRAAATACARHRGPVSQLPGVDVALGRARRRRVPWDRGPPAGVVADRGGHGSAGRSGRSGPRSPALSGRPGDEAILAPGDAGPFLPALRGVPDVTSIPIGRFEERYARDPDPWGFATRWYEARKYALTLAALPRSPLPAGVRAGVLDRRADRGAGRPMRLSAGRRRRRASALEQARDRLAALDHVELAQAGTARTSGPRDRGTWWCSARSATTSTPTTWPGCWTGRPRPWWAGATLLAVHWRGATDYPLTRRRGSRPDRRSPGLRTPRRLPRGAVPPRRLRRRRSPVTARRADSDVVVVVVPAHDEEELHRGLPGRAPAGRRSPRPGPTPGPRRRGPRRLPGRDRRPGDRGSGGMARPVGRGRRAGRPHGRGGRRGRRATWARPGRSDSSTPSSRWGPSIPKRCGWPRPTPTAWSRATGWPTTCELRQAGAEGCAGRSSSTRGTTIRRRPGGRFEAGYPEGEQGGLGHPHVHGTNFGVSMAAYVEAGGFSALATGEDHALWRALIDGGPAAGGDPAGAGHHQRAPPRPQPGRVRGHPGPVGTSSPEGHEHL